MGVTEILLRAQRGDKAALEEAHQIMREFPAVADHVEDLAGIVRDRLIAVCMTIDSKNALLKEALRHKAEKLERQLRGAAPSFLEKMLCERIATCYLAVELAELDANVGGVTLAKAAYYDKRLALTHKRYTQALESLARIRRLQLPIQQINIAQPGSQQMNIATTAAPTEAPPAIQAA